MERLGDKIFLLSRVIERTARGYSVEANLKYIRDVIPVLGSGRLETRVDSKCEEDTNDRVTGGAGEREASRVQDSRGKAAVGVLGACRHCVQRQGNSRKGHVSHRERREKRIARYLKGVPSGKCSIEINRFPPHVNVYTDSDSTPKRARAQAVESRSGEARLFLLGQENTVSELDFCRSRITRSDNWNFRRDGGETPLEKNWDTKSHS